MAGDHGKEGQKTYELKAGTILDERYEIIRVLGAGGFGITYEAVNRRVKIRVAIKEYFCREYMTRDARKTNKVLLRSAADEPRLLEEKKRFIREARIVSDFQNEPGIVHVIDYFEANHTAYIVMEYLDGTTLLTYQTEHGRFPAAEIAGMMMPLMKTLGKLHEAGVLHRDISPDNIMVMKDKTLRLMDFGAAGRNDGEGSPDQAQKEAGAAPAVKNETSRKEDGVAYGTSFRLKDGYAALEQYGRSGREGAWTDVYALSATMYTCMTGNVPENALLRSIYDELPAPSAMGVKIQPRLEKILMKGLAVRPEDRGQNMAEYLELLQAALPDQKKKGAGRRAVILAAAVTAALAAGGIWWGYASTHIAKYKFRGRDTVRIHVSAPEDMTAQDFFDDTEILRERLNVLAGSGGYLWNEEGNEIVITLPEDVFGSCAPDEAVKQYLTASYRMKLEGSWREISGTTTFYRKEILPMEFRQEKDIASLSPEPQDDGQDADGNARSVQGAAASAGESADVDSDADAAPDGLETGSDGTEDETDAVIGEGRVSEAFLAELSRYEADAFLVSMDTAYTVDYGDGWLDGTQDALVINNDGSVAVTDDLLLVPDELRELFLWDLCHEPMTDSLISFCEPEVKWEDPSNQKAPGEMQVSPEDMPENTDILIYHFARSYSLDEPMTEAEQIAAVPVFKQRLDACGRPYAFGEPSASNGTFYVMTGRDEFTGIEALALGRNRAGIGDAENWISSFECDTALEAGETVLVCRLSDSGSSIMKDDMTLSAGDYTFAGDAVFDAAKNSISFQKINLLPELQTPQHLTHLCGLISGMEEGNFYSKRILSGSVYFSFAGRAPYDRTEGSFPGAVTMDTGLTDDEAFRALLELAEKRGGKGRMRGPASAEIFFKIQGGDAFVRNTMETAQEMCSGLNRSKFTQNGSGLFAGDRISFIFEDDEDTANRCTMELSGLGEQSDKISINIRLVGLNDTLRKQMDEYAETQTDFFHNYDVKTECISLPAYKAE